MKNMVVIGGGPAGMMTAVKAADSYNVVLIEKNEKLGKKLFITGKGRCNLTNDSDQETFLKNVITNYKFLYSAIYSYDQQAVMADFERWGLDIKTERGNRVFPLSDHSSDVIKTLENVLKDKGVKVLLNTSVTAIQTEADEEEKRVTGVYAGGKFFPADVVVVATGGLSYPQTGSTGDGFMLINAAEPEIDITETFPALCPLVIREDFCKEMMGLSLRNVKASVICREADKKGKVKDKKLYEEQGEMLFTHFGVTGPLMLSASSYIVANMRKNKVKLNRGMIEPAEDDLPSYRITIDLKPALSHEELDRRVVRDFEKYSNREFINALNELLPRLLIPVIVRLSGIPQDKRVNLISREERERLVRLLKSLEMNVAGIKGYNEAIITSGGISVKELNSSTMEFKKVRGLRAAGEIIDVDALTGGFNLQIAWSTAYLAASE